MKIRTWLYGGLAGTLAIVAAGIFWLSKHREFADPTWLEHADALTVQAAWVQAIFSVIAIIVAIVIGEVQHNRTRTMFDKEKQAREDEKREQTQKAAELVLYTLAGEHLAQDNIKTALDTFCEETNPDSSHSTMMLIVSITQGALSQPFLRSPELMRRLELLTGDAFSEVLASASHAEQIHSTATAMMKGIVMTNPDEPVNKTPLINLRNAISRTLEQIVKAERSVQLQYGLAPVREEDDASADGTQAAGKPEQAG